MGLEDIKKKIISNAEAKRTEALDVARKQADAVLTAGKKEITNYSTDYERNAKSLAENIERGLVIDARRTLANTLLAKKREHINTTYAKAKTQFIESADYANILQTIVVQSVQSKKEEVVLGKNEKNLNAAWLDSVNKAASANLTFSKEPGSFEGGVILRDGDTYINITADVLLGLIREKTEKPVAHILFGE